jgi:cell wall-associated NlpC family hydrolase
MRRHHRYRSGFSRLKPFFVFGTLAASLSTSPLSLNASERFSAKDDASSSAYSTEQVSNPSCRIPELYENVKQYLGIRYRFGGTTPAGFDCSGFVRFMFGKVFDMKLPRSSREMSNIGTQVDRNELKPGDLVFFHNRGKRINHVGIFVGNGMFVHSSLSKGITRDRLDEKYYDRNFATGVRVLDAPDQQTQQELERISRDYAENSASS